MTQQTLIYGFHAVEEALRDPRLINQIWTASGHRNSRLKRLLEEAHQKKIPIKIVDRHALARLAGTSHHQDLVLEISSHRYLEAEELLAEVKEDSIFCILDEIQDATNLGTLIRTIEGAGVQGVFLPERRSAAITAVTHKLSAGALHHVRVDRFVNIANLMDQMKEKGIRIICADSSAQKMWHEADYSGAIAILVGNEQKGVRRLLKEKSDELVRIPMLGKVQSLNVNVAAAILLYEAIRQRL